MITQNHRIMLSSGIIAVLFVGLYFLNLLLVNMFPPFISCSLASTMSFFLGVGFAAFKKKLKTYTLQ